MAANVVAPPPPPAAPMPSSLLPRQRTPGHILRQEHYLESNIPPRSHLDNMSRTFRSVPADQTEPRNHLPIPIPDRHPIPTQAPTDEIRNAHIQLYGDHRRPDQSRLAPDLARTSSNQKQTSKPNGTVLSSSRPMRRLIAKRAPDYMVDQTPLSCRLNNFTISEHVPNHIERSPRILKSPSHQVSTTSSDSISVEVLSLTPKPRPDQAPEDPKSPLLSTAHTNNKRNQDSAEHGDMKPHAATQPESGNSGSSSKIQIIASTVESPKPPIGNWQVKTAIASQFECPFCLRRFAQQSRLARYQRKLHLNMGAAHCSPKGNPSSPSYDGQKGTQNLDSQSQCRSGNKRKRLNKVAGEPSKRYQTRSQSKIV